MEYSLEFSERLIETAKSFIGKGNAEEETDRLVLYLSLLSSEISLKALLEKAGYATERLKRRSHDLSCLMKDLCSCDLPGTEDADAKKLGAGILLSKLVDPAFPHVSVGIMLTLSAVEFSGASKYQIKKYYGGILRHYPPLTVLSCAEIVCRWAKENLPRIKIRE